MKKGTTQQPPINADVITGEIGGNLLEIILVKRLSFRPTLKHADGADYSDRIDTDDEIESTHLEIDVAYKESLSNAGKLATERQTLFTWP